MAQLQITPLHPLLGAEVVGVDLSQPIDEPKSGRARPVTASWSRASASATSPMVRRSHDSDRSVRAHVPARIPSVVAETSSRS